MASNTVIRTNVLALNSHRNLGMVGIQKEKSSQKLSSGYRINSAADDAAGLAISEKMRAQIRGLDMANKNTQDGISLIQTAEGGMQEIDNMVQRIRELVVYASNDTQDQSSSADLQGDRTKIQDEIDQLLEEIDSMANRVEFNKKTLINGTYSAVGMTKYEDRSTAAVDVYNARSTLAVDQYNSMSTYTSNMASAEMTLKSNIFNAEQALLASTNGGIIDPDAKSTYDASLLKAQSSYDKSIVNANSSFETNMKNAKSSFDKGVFEALSTLGGKSVGGTVLWFQTGANAGQGMRLSINSVTTDSLGLAVGLGKQGKVVDIMNNTGSNTTDLLKTIDKALTVVTTERSKLGAAQNRLEYTSNSLQISSENLSGAESRVRNTDMGKEMMNLTQANILQQASISMLAQGNQQPQSILQLLQ